MCGIAGILKFNNQEISQNTLTAMGDSIAHRGPDAMGTYMDSNVGLVHRRLSIIDLSDAGNQPFFSQDKDFVLVFNGEIFNYREFYPELKSKGYSFHSSSDTEVLLYLLMEYGVKVLPRLRGFFAFAFWDKKGEKLFLVRDRFGVKPLFYFQSKDQLVFGSEPKSIFASGVQKSIRQESLTELLFYRYTSGETTVFNDVNRLLPGHYMQIDLGTSKTQIHRWFHLGESIKNQSTISNPLEWFEESFNQSIAYRMVSDVPVGTLLSGGLDSSSVLYSQVHQGFKDVSAWNVSISNYKFDESNLARSFSESLGVDFHTFEFRGENLLNLVKRAISNHDEPLMHLQDGHLLGLSEKARKKVKVLLSGEGADEVLGGYVRYKVHDSRIRYQFLQILPFLPNSLLKSDRWKKMKRYLAMGGEDFQLMSNSNEHFLSDFSELGFLESNLRISYRERILKEAKELYPTNPLRQLLYLEQHTHLYTLNDRNDRTTMGASIECRDPFLDVNLVVGVGSLGDEWFNTKGKGKRLLFESIGKKLPSYLQDHPKIGFSIPWERYFLDRDDFREVYEQLPNSELLQVSPFNLFDIKSLMRDFEKGDKSKLSIIKQLFFLSLWYQVQFGK